jgi:hypothetical protein
MSSRTWRTTSLGWPAGSEFPVFAAFAGGDGAGAAAAHGDDDFTGTDVLSLEDVGYGQLRPWSARRIASRHGDAAH